MTVQNLRSQRPTAQGIARGSAPLPYLGMGNQQRAAAAALPALETCTENEATPEQKALQEVAGAGYDLAKGKAGEWVKSKVLTGSAKAGAEFLEAEKGMITMGNMAARGGAVGKALGGSAGVGALIEGGTAVAGSIWENAENVDKAGFDATDASADVMMDGAAGAVKGAGAGVGALIGTAICPGVGTAVGGFLGGLVTEWGYNKLMAGGGEKASREWLSKTMDGMGAEDAMKWGWGKLGGARKYADSWLGTGETCSTTEQDPGGELARCDVPCPVPELDRCPETPKGCVLPPPRRRGPGRPKPPRGCVLPPPPRRPPPPKQGGPAKVVTPPRPTFQPRAAAPAVAAPSPVAAPAPAIAPPVPAVAAPAPAVTAPAVTGPAAAPKAPGITARLPPSCDAELPGLAPHLPRVLPQGVLPPPARVADPKPAQVPPGAARAMKALNAARNRPV